MLINPQCLGYQHIADLGIVTAFGNEKEVTSFLENKPYISELVGPLGEYNFYGKVALQDLNKVNEIIEDLESNPYIKHVDALIWAEAVNIEYPQNLIIRPLNGEDTQKQSQYPAVTNHNQVHIEMDEIDKNIAKILTENSRTPFKNIAAKLQISSKTVIQRYKKLRENLLTLSTITVDLNKLGYKALGNLFIKVENRSRMPEIYTKLLQIPNVIVLIRLMGMYDLYCAIALEDFQKLFETYEKITKIDGIETPAIHLTRAPQSWPLNLFPSLLESKYMKPKYWLGNQTDRLTD